MSVSKPSHIASCSFGKDSLAAILLAKLHGEPLDEAIYCEVMFDRNISGEVPEHREFIYTTAIPALERMGVKVTVLRSMKTYVDLFTGKITRGPKKGLLRAFPICGRCYVQRDCKLKPIQADVPQQRHRGNSGKATAKIPKALIRLDFYTFIVPHHRPNYNHFLREAKGKSAQIFEVCALFVRSL